MEGREVLAAGLICSIGTGAETNAWDDNWISRDDLKRPVACLTENPPLLVSKFIDRTTGTWDVQKLNIHMVPFDVQIIRNIPITTRLQAYFWAWHHDRKGLFTVRSAYRMLAAMKEPREAWFKGRALSSDYRVLQENWTNLWHISVPAKLKFFLWRLARQSLPTMDLLQN
jgi:hypothetical protein